MSRVKLIVQGAWQRVVVLWWFLDQIGWIIALVFLAVAFLQLHHQGVKEQRQGVSVEALRVAQLRSCHRLNVLRASDNRSHYDDYLFDSQLLGLLNLALTQPSTPNPRLTVEQRTSDLKLFKDFIKGLRSDVAHKQWTPLTECYPAVDHPLTYVAPTPRAFAHHPPPPPSAFHVKVGDGE